MVTEEKSALRNGLSTTTILAQLASSRCRCGLVHTIKLTGFTDALDDTLARNRRYVATAADRTRRENLANEAFRLSPPFRRAASALYSRHVTQQSAAIRRCAGIVFELLAIAFIQWRYMDSRPSPRRPKSCLAAVSSLQPAS